MLRSSKGIPEFAAIRKNVWLYTPTVDLPRVQNPPAELKRHWLLFTRDGQWPFGDAISDWLGADSDWSFERRGSGLFVYRRAKRVSTKDLQAWLDDAFLQANEFHHRIASESFDSTIDDGEITSHKVVLQFKKTWRI